MRRAALALAVLGHACGPGAPPPPVDGGAPLDCRPGSSWAPGERPAFVERTADWGLDGLQGHALATGDLDGDGWADLVTIDGITNLRGTTHVFFNRPRAGGGRTFEDVTDGTGLLATRDGAGGRLVNLAVIGDLDADGDADVITGIFRDHAQDAEYLGDVAEVMLNDGTGHFTLGPPLPLWDPPEALHTSIALTDADRDGHLDAFFAFWFEQPPFSSAYGQHPELLRGTGGAEFVHAIHDSGIELRRSTTAIEDGTHVRPLFGATVCDVDGDGAPDMLGAAYGQMWNLLWVQRDGRFVEVGRESGVAGDAIGDGSWQQNGNTFSIACGDVDGDGDLDLYTGEIRHADARGAYTDPSELLVNVSEGGEVRFDRPGRDAMGLAPPPGPTREEGGQNNALFDFDADGRLDVYLGGSAYSMQEQASWLFQQHGPMQFRWLGADSGFDHSCPHGMAIADFDHDGDEDVVVGTYGCADEWSADLPQPFRLYENVSHENDWISIRAIGSGPGGANGEGIGARVRVTAGGVTRTREIHGSWGRISLSREPVAYVGLGSTCEPLRVEIRWPDAALSTTVLEGVPPNHRIVVRQGRPGFEVLP